MSAMDISEDARGCKLKNRNIRSAYPLQGPNLVHPVLRRKGTPDNYTSEFIELEDISYRVLKPEVYKQLCPKLRVVVRKFADRSDQCKKSINTFKLEIYKKFIVGSDQRKKLIDTVKRGLLLAMVPFDVAADFLLYIIEEGVKAEVIDYLFGWVVILVAGLLSWEVKGVPFRERFVMEQPEDHMAHLTLKGMHGTVVRKLLEDGTEVRKLLKDNTELQELTTNVIADHSSRIIEVEKVLMQQFALIKRLETAVDTIEGVLKGQKAEEEPNAPVEAEEEPNATPTEMDNPKVPEILFRLRGSWSDTD